LIKYKLWNTQKVIPRKLKELINAGTLGKINDTPKPGDTIFTNIHNVIIGNNNIACNSIKLFLESKGIKTTYLGSKFTGRSRSLGKVLFKLVDDFPTVSTPYAFVLGGETTVELKNTANGVGGRNQESVLSAASYFEEQLDNMDFTIASFGTDGIDGNSLDAGAILNPSVLSKIRKKRLKILNALKNHNSNVLFNKVNGALHTKITGTNVNDVCIVCRLR
jgi:glycerate-2-kinase